MKKDMAIIGAGQPALKQTDVKCWRVFKNQKPNDGMLIVVRWRDYDNPTDFSQPFFYNEVDCVGYIGDDDMWFELPACT